MHIIVASTKSNSYGQFLTFLRVDFHSRVIFTCVNKIEALYERFEST